MTIGSWYVTKALDGMRDSSNSFQEVEHVMFRQHDWILLQIIHCRAFSGRLDSLSGWHGGDFYTEGEPEVLDDVDRRRS